ncbi:MAG: sigma-54 dependent transcriptional regulator [Vicinamibacterales bacterium]
MTRPGQSARILVVDDDAAIRDSLRMILEYQGYAVMTAATGDEGVALVEREAPDLVFLDVKMPGMDGLEVLQRVTHLTDVTPIVVMSGHGTISTAVEATRLGAFDFVEKPVETERLLVLVRNAIDSRRLRAENRTLRKDQEKRHQIVGDSAGLTGVRAAIEKASPTNATVLIWGESGVGKELVARAVHRESLRRDGPFVQVNCAAIPDELIESELFGHEKGSFTGASDRQIGKFEQADKGTIFLDEIGDMSLKTQAKVLRVLQEQELERLGSNRPIKVDVRVIAATSKDLEQEITKDVPGGPVLPPQRGADLGAAAARTAGGHPGAGPPLRRQLRARKQLPPQDLHRCGDGAAATARLAGQHPRAAQHRRAAHDHVEQRRHRRRRPSTVGVGAR